MFSLPLITAGRFCFMTDKCPAITKLQEITMAIITESVITCPVCGFSKEEEMPADTCQYFYECENCRNLLKPEEGDCCIYCSYGSVKCPSMQGSYKNH